MMEQVFIFLGFVVFVLGIAGIVSSRNIIIMLLSTEVIMLAASFMAVVFFNFNVNGSIVPLLFAIWSIAAAEVIMVIVFYRYLAGSKASLDVKSLSKLRD